MTLHKHHIIPLHVGGTDDSNNLIELTISDHANAHLELFRKYGRWQDELAWKGLSGIIGHEDAVKISYGAANKGMRRSIKTEFKGGERKGIPHSIKTKQAISKTLKDKGIIPPSKRILVGLIMVKYQK